MACDVSPVAMFSFVFVFSFVFFLFTDRLFIDMYLLGMHFCFMFMRNSYFETWQNLWKTNRSTLEEISLNQFGRDGYKKKFSCKVRDPYLGYSCLKTSKTLPNMHFHCTYMCAQPFTTFSLTLKKELEILFVIKSFLLFQDVEGFQWHSGCLQVAI